MNRRITMTTIDNTSATRTDLDYAIHLITTGQKDPGFASRVQAKTERITEEIRRNTAC
jgi:hypothetical protein